MNFKYQRKRVKRFQVHRRHYLRFSLLPFQDYLKVIICGVRNDTAFIEGSDKSTEALANDPEWEKNYGKHTPSIIIGL